MRQTILIVLGVLRVIISFLEFLHIKSRLLIYKRVSEYLGENKRIKYQRATALPGAVLGIIWVISGVFFWNQEFIHNIGVSGAWYIWNVWQLVINKKHLGYFFPRNVPRISDQRQGG